MKNKNHQHKPAVQEKVKDVNPLLGYLKNGVSAVGNMFRTRGMRGVSGVLLNNLFAIMFFILFLSRQRDLIL